MCIFVQDYVETAEQIDCLAPLPEDPADALLMEMLVLAPYKVPEKKAEKKAPGIRKVSGVRLCRKPHPKTTRHTPPPKGKKKRRRPPHPERMRGLRGWTRGQERPPAQGHHTLIV